MSYIYLYAPAPGNVGPWRQVVGFYNPSGEWLAESEHATKEQAADRVHWLNGGIVLAELEQMLSPLLMVVDRSCGSAEEDELILGIDTPPKRDA